MADTHPVPVPGPPPPRFRDMVKDNPLQAWPDLPAAPDAPVCGKQDFSPTGEPVACTKLVKGHHPSWHGNGTITWKTVYGQPEGTAPKQPAPGGPSAARRSAAASAAHWAMTAQGHLLAALDADKAARPEAAAKQRRDFADAQDMALVWAAVARIR